MDEFRYICCNLLLFIDGLLPHFLIPLVYRWNDSPHCERPVSALAIVLSPSFHPLIWSGLDTQSLAFDEGDRPLLNCPALSLSGFPR